MQLDGDVCYRAVKTRDARFDGRFFTGVTSTGIYCRPICPAPTPQRKNCRFFACAAAAQEAGFRPCLRCRPEISPSLPAFQGTLATITRALRLISEGVLDSGSVETLAARLGIGERHLRRLFDEHLGASPLAVSNTRRLLLAKRLLTETALPITQICYASGFASVRRFNDAMLGTYKRPPRELRGSFKGAKAASVGVRGLAGKTARSASTVGVSAVEPGRASTSVIELKLPFRPPYNWEVLTRFLAPRAIPGIEQVTPEFYRRSLFPGEIEVRPVRGANHLAARIELASVCELGIVAERLRRLFDTDAPIVEIEEQLSADPRLAAAIKAQPGVRVPGCWEPFELAVRAILGQQVTVKGATTLAGRMVEKFGGFPTPQRVADSDLAGVGLPQARAESIRAVARAFACGNILSAEALRDLPGIGDWTAQYIALRAFNEPDAFPAADLGLLRALCPNDRSAQAARELSRRAEAWRPWRAYAAMHLWMEKRND